MNHGSVGGIPCASCHNGTFTSQGSAGALGVVTPPHIPTGTLECINCHTNTSTFTAYTMKHSAVTGIACASCHNGLFAAEGTSGAQGKGPGHIATTLDCATCHTSTTSWANATFNHTGITGGCASCHNNTAALGITTPPHIPTGTLECFNCHTNTTTFTAYTMQHTAVTGISCSACHNGTYTGEGNIGRAGQGSEPRRHDGELRRPAIPAPRIGRERHSVTPASPAVAPPATTARLRPA